MVENGGAGKLGPRFFKIDSENDTFGKGSLGFDVKLKDIVIGHPDGERGEAVGQAVPVIIVNVGNDDIRRAFSLRPPWIDPLRSSREVVSKGTEEA